MCPWSTLAITFVALMHPSTLIVFANEVSLSTGIRQDTATLQAFLTDTLINAEQLDRQPHSRGGRDTTAGDPSLWTQHDWHPAGQHQHVP